MLPSTESANSFSQPHEVADPELDTLRDILFSRYRHRIGELEEQVASLEERLADQDRLAALVTPILGEAIRRKINENRDEMITALYPIIGQVVSRAVAEAIRDLARRIDRQMRTSFNLASLGRRWWARARGISEAEIMMREALPFEVAEIFLIHRETSLLIYHISQQFDTSADSHLISSMLSAIRDFAQEAFGQGQTGQLDEIQYGARRILVEAGQYVYLALVIDGIEPSGFRDQMRQEIIEIEQSYGKILRHYDGNRAPLASVEAILQPLLTPVR
jgi:hypothetical protein